MKPLQLILLLVLAIPFIEMYLLLQVGGLIGAFPTIFLVVFTAALGSWLLKQQGFATFRRFQETLAHGSIPTLEILEGMLIMLGGALLLTPGFITDAIGLFCLIPQCRSILVQFILEKKLFQMIHPSRQTTTEKDVLEGEFRRED